MATGARQLAHHDVRVLDRLPLGPDVRIRLPTVAAIKDALGLAMKCQVVQDRERRPQAGRLLIHVALTALRIVCGEVGVADRHGGQTHGQPVIALCCFARKDCRLANRLGKIAGELKGDVARQGQPGQIPVGRMARPKGIFRLAGDLQGFAKATGRHVGD